MDHPVFLDSNIFMYAAGKPHRYKNPCLHILKDVETKVLSAIINTEVLQELLYRYAHIGIPEKGLQLCLDVLKYPVRILPVAEEDMRKAIELFGQYRSKGLKPRDIVHAATMKTSNITKIMSADKNFDVFDSLTRIDPLSYVPRTDKKESE